MDKYKYEVGEQVLSWITGQLENDFTEQQAAAISVAVLYGAVFQDQLKEFFNDHIEDIINEVKANKDGEDPVD